VPFADAATVLATLYLAVLFQTFGARQGPRRHTPFGSGLEWPEPTRKHRWKTAVFVLAVQLVTFGGIAAALDAWSDALVAGLLGFLAFTVGLPQTLWAAQLLAPKLTQTHARGILNAAFLGPLVVGAIVGALVACL
jgi:hypothetical protein